MFKPLGRSDVEKIHKDSLDILETAGVEVKNSKAIAHFKNAGARVVEENNRVLVYISPEMVENALKTVPVSFTLHGRNEKKTVTFERGNPPLYGGSGVPINIHDLDTGKRREAKLKDLITLVKLLDGLSGTDYITTPCTYNGVPEEAEDITTFFHMVNHTSKPFGIDMNTDYGYRDVMSLAEMLKEKVFGGKTFMAFGSCPVICPLKLDDLPVEHFIEAARAGFPLAPISMTQFGVTSPASVSATITLMNAEMLCMIVLSQLVKPGVAFLYGTIPGATNFSTGEMLTAAPELPLLNIGGTQMAEYYNLPNWATAGRTESKQPDIQAGYEHAYSVPFVAMSGATYISAIGGFLESVCSLSMEKFVIDNEAIEMMKKVMTAIPMDDTESIELIKSIGPGGNFLGEVHTVKHMRDFFIPKIGDTSYFTEWVDNHQPIALKNANKKAKEVIASHETPALPEYIIKEISHSFPKIVIDAIE
ncbi:MAG: trimethylamine methyltransferase family protein [Desulfobacterales bacterium]|nr:trimethylamine methyltransferase family protein [Desulfobacterales bacterium]